MEHLRAHNFKSNVSTVLSLAFDEIFHQTSLSRFTFHYSAPPTTKRILASYHFWRVALISDVHGANLILTFQWFIKRFTQLSRL